MGIYERIKSLCKLRGISVKELKAVSIIKPVKKVAKGCKK